MPGRLSMKQTKIQKELSSFPHFDTVFYFSDGWSMHQLISHLVQLSGPCELFVSSFSICEHAIRIFQNLKMENKVQQLTLLLDFNVFNTKRGLLFFLENSADQIYFTKCHAKTIIILNKNVRWCVVSSANLNVNNKHESGIVTRNPQVVDTAILKFQDIMSKSVKHK